MWEEKKKKKKKGVCMYCMYNTYNRSIGSRYKELEDSGRDENRINYIKYIYICIIFKGGRKFLHIWKKGGGSVFFFFFLGI